MMFIVMKYVCVMLQVLNGSLTSIEWKSHLSELNGWFNVGVCHSVEMKR